MASEAVVAAVDVGAASGRVMRAVVGPDRLDLVEVERFENVPVRVAGALRWDVPRIVGGILDGLRAAGPVDSVGIDTWAVDYGLIDGDGRLLAQPVHYRDARTEGVLERILDLVPAEELYATAGLQLLPFNTIFQLAADPPQWTNAEALLLMPDLLAHWLTGVVGAERTNASTTGLLDVTTGGWATPLMERLGIPARLFPPVREPGTTIGVARPEIVERLHHAGPARVTAVGSHDTASAVVGVPARGDRFAYISCGTWSLVGVELARPILTPESRAANFTNEVGVDGTIRYLRNVMGLWLLQECLRAWPGTDLASLLHQAAALPPFAAVVDAGDPVFLPPGDMPARIAQACRGLGQPAPTTPAGVVRCIVDSLALAHRAAIRDAQRLSGRDIDVIHIVGGGSHNELLCQLTADACGLPVEAGPAEATALGNVLVQARALRSAGAGLSELRALVRATHRVRRYAPAGDPAAWSAAAARLPDPARPG